MKYKHTPTIQEKKGKALNVMCAIGDQIPFLWYWPKISIIIKLNRPQTAFLLSLNESV